MAQSPTNNFHSANRRVAEKAKHEAQANKAASFQQLLSRLSPAQIYKARVLALEAANKATLDSGRPISAEAVVRDAQVRFEHAVRFLLDQEDAP